MPSIFDLCSSKSCLFKLSGSVIVSFPSFVLGSAGMELKLPGLQKKAGYSAILNEPAVCCSLRYPTCFVILTIPTLTPPPIPSKVTLLDSNINIVNTAALPDIIGMPISVGICIYAPTKNPTLFDHYSQDDNLPLYQVAENLWESFDGAQDERREVDIDDNFPFMLRLSKHS